MYSADQTQVNSCARVHLELRASALRAHFLTRVYVCEYLWACSSACARERSSVEHTRERVYKTLRRSLVYAGILLTSVLYYCVFSSTTFKMPRVSLETRRRIVAISKSGYSVPDIQNRLAEERIYTSKVSIYKILKKYQQHGVTTDLPRGSHTPKLSLDQIKFIDNAMAENDELTGRQMRELLHEKWPNLDVSISTIKRARQNIGWVSTRPKYCQLVRAVNMEKRLSWCKQQISAKETFHNVVFRRMLSTTGEPWQALLSKEK